jgi:ABC-type Na+ efflux pump permease subunit
MRLNTTRIRAISRKELREYRHNRQLIVTMSVLPLIFILTPAIQIFAQPNSAAGALAHQQILVYMLSSPAIVPATFASISVAGERQQGTLEPVLTTPIRREEFLVGKALAALVPAITVSYLVFAVFVAAIELFAQPAVASAVLHGPELVAQVVFTPLLAALSIWIGIAISARSNDPRVAAQLSVLASLPAIVVTTLIAEGKIHATLHLALVLGAVLVVLDIMGWRIVSPAFDRERLITGTR